MWLPTTGDTAAGNAALCALWDSIPEAPIEWNECDEFTQAYIQCALWSSTDDTDTPMDKNYYPDDISRNTLGQMIRDCQRFQDHARYIERDHFDWDDLQLFDGSEFTGLQMAGHDFWLTRNNHGAGFWDGDWEQSAGEKLTALSKSFGEFNLYTHEGIVHGQ